MLGAIIETFGWVWSFYIPGIMCILWVGLWSVLISDTPQNHKGISEEELKYIEVNIGDSISKEKVNHVNRPASYQLFTAGITQYVPPVDL